MQKIRIFALAKELNLDSKDLIEVCAKVGIILKNSALASISPEEKERVLDFLKQSSSAAPASKAAPPPVVREVPKHVDKPLVNIMAAKAQGPRLVPKTRALGAGAEDTAGVQPVASTATMDAPVETRRSSEAAETVSKTTAEETVTTTATTSAEAVTQQASDPSSTPVSDAGLAGGVEVPDSPVGQRQDSSIGTGESETREAEARESVSTQTPATSDAITKAASRSEPVGASDSGSKVDSVTKRNPASAASNAPTRGPVGGVPFKSGSVRTIQSGRSQTKSGDSIAVSAPSVKGPAGSSTAPSTLATSAVTTPPTPVSSPAVSSSQAPASGASGSGAPGSTFKSGATKGSAPGAVVPASTEVAPVDTKALASAVVSADDAGPGDETNGVPTTSPVAAPEEPVAKAPTPVKPPEKPPLRRDDYIAPGGVRRTFNMVPQGTVDMSKAANKAVDAKKLPKSRPGPILPSLAAMPEYKAVVVPQPVAQKPDMKLPTGATINDVKPLEKLLRSKTAADAKKKTDDDKAVPKKRGILTLEEEIEAAGKAKAKLGVKRGAGLEDSRKIRQQKRGTDDEDEGSFRSGRAAKRPKHKSFVAPAKTSSEIELPITIRSLSECIGRPAKELLKILFMRNAAGAVTINSMIDEDTAIELALEVGVDLTIRRERDLEQELFQEEEAFEPGEGVTRPPIITILGHVDHGKTTLLDTIRGAKVAAGEAGGITQHIAAYQVEKNGHKLTFVDTPGHAAFTSMRARGASVTDIIVLVVAADDGVMPQTAEAISHAKAAGVPIIVALNKCDLPGRNEQKVLQDLARHEIMPTEWGGDVEVVRTSGLTGIGIDDLLETLLLTAELHEYKANPDAPAAGVCLEAFRDEGRGTVAWLMVQRGTLRIGDTLVCGEAVGRIRNIYNDRGEDIREAGPSTPVKVSGLDVVPSPGDKFVVTEDGDAARQLADDRRSSERAKLLASKVRPMTLEDVLDKVKGGGVRDLPLIIKADSPGSLEALRHELSKFDHPEVRVTVVHEGVGGVNESDVYLASATKSVIIAFHVIPEDRAEILAEQEGVEIRQYQIIYEVTDHIKLALEGLLKPDLQQVSTGRALVLRTFFISRVGGTIAGCRVLNGTIERSNRVRVIRDHRVLHEYAIGSLKREKDDVKEVREGYECGIRLENFNDVKEGDLFEAYRIEEVKRKLE